MLRLSDNPPITFPDDLLTRARPAIRGGLGTRRRGARKHSHTIWSRDRSNFFLPMIPRVRISGGRKRHGLSPLFPSYVFFCADEAERAAALATDRLCQAIPVRNQGQLARELTSLDRLLKAGMRLELYPFATVGKRCRISAGPFEGMEGTVVQRKEDRAARMVLEVSMLGQGAAMEIEADLLEPV